MIYSLQILANKARFFNQMRSSTVISRELSYSDDSALTYGQVKAAATGDILLLEHVNVSLSVDAYERLHSSLAQSYVSCYEVQQRNKHCFTCNV